MTAGTRQAPAAGPLTHAAAAAATACAPLAAAADRDARLSDCCRLVLGEDAGGDPAALFDRQAARFSPGTYLGVTDAACGCLAPAVAGTAQIMVLVWDANPDPPARIKAGEEAENGRGLMLVEAISEQWGWFPRQNGNGKFVWAIAGSSTF